MLKVLPECLHDGAQLQVNHECGVVTCHRLALDEKSPVARVNFQVGDGVVGQLLYRNLFTVKRLQAT